MGYHENPFQAFMMNYYKMGSGPYYVFYRPYHLCHVESIASIVSPVLDGFSLLEPTYGFQTNVFAYAKKPLEAGVELDGIGGHCCYGLIENVGPDGHPGLPLALAEKVVLASDIDPNEPILMTDIDAPFDRDDYRYFDQALVASARLRSEIQSQTELI